MEFLTGIDESLQHNKKYYAIYNNEVVYTILRGDFAPYRWIAFDKEMNKVGNSHTFRDNLFKEIEDIFYAGKK